MVSRESGDGGSCAALVAAAVVLAALASGLSLILEGNIWLALVVLAAISATVVWLARSVSGPRTPTARELARRFEVVREMGGPQFEVFVADLFRAMGHRATMLGRSGDQGVDVIVDYRGERVAVQCKNYKRAAGNRPVQEVFAGARHHGCQQAWVVAPAGFTGGARELAGSTGVSLHDADSIRRWIRQVDRLERGRVTDEARKRASWQAHPDDPP